MKKFFVLMIILFLTSSSACSLANKEVVKASDSSTSNISTPTNAMDLASLLNPGHSLGAPANWTVMAYLDGDNNLEDCAIAKFLSMSQIGSTSNVKLVAELDRTSGYDTSYGDWTDTKRFNITTGMTPTSSNAIQDLGEKNMGDPNTLSSFISWTAQNYPANHYLLILFDHGSGVVQMTSKPQAPSEQPLGIIFDDTDYDYLTTPELGQALNSGGTTIGVLYLDACSMGMIEVGYQVASYADVLVASEETGWADIPDSVYNTTIASLVSTPSQSSSALGTSIVNAYVDYWSSISPYQITCSAVDLTKFRSTGLITSTSAFAQTLQTKYPDYATQIQTAKAQSEGFEGPYGGDYSYYIDLYDFADHVYNSVSDTALRNAANQVKTNLTAATIISRQSNHLNAHGTSIFFPNTRSEYNGYNNTYKATAFAASTNWDEWLDTYFSTVILDAFEPDDSFSQYSSMTVTTSLQFQSRSIEPTDDNDYIRFYATPAVYTFYTSSYIDTYGYLYDSSQNQLAYDDDGGGSLQFRICCSITSSGYYFLRVRGFSSSEEGPYNLYYQYTTTSSGDAYEPDDSFSQYSSMTVTTSLQSQSRSIEPTDDNDYIRFYATPATYTFYTSSSIDTYGYLYDSSQNQLAYDDDNGGSLQFYISYSITSSGYYFLRVRGYSSSTEGPYTLYYQCSDLVPPTVSASMSTIDQGQTSSLTSTPVTTGTPPYTYQWYEQTPSGSILMVGSNSPSFNFVTSGSTSLGNWSFILQVTDSTSASVYSAAVTVTVNSALAAPSVKSTITVGSGPVGVAVTPNGAYAYVTNGGDNSVSVINTATNTVTATIGVRSNPELLAVTPNGAYAYVVNGANNSVSVINTSTNTVTATITVGYQPIGVAITPNGAYAYVTNEGDNSVSVINTATNIVTATIPVGSYPVGVAVTPSGAYVYVANLASSTVSVINTATNSVTATIPVGYYPVGVAFTPNGAYAYVANEGEDSVSVINTSTNAITATIAVGHYPVIVASNGTYAYVTNEADNSVSVINTATNAVVATVTVGSMPVGVAVTPSGAYVYVANFGGNTVSVINVGPLTVSASLGTMYQGQTSTLNSPVITTGTSPYTYKWFVKAPSGSYALINGATSSSYSFATSTSNATGSWSFILQVTDSVGQALNSTAVSVTLNPLTITVTQTANGVIAPGTTNVNYSSSQSFTITPNNGYHIASITTDTGTVTVTSPSGQTVGFTNIQAPRTLTATFALTSNPTPSPESGGEGTSSGASSTASTSTPTPSPTATPSPTPTATPTSETVIATTGTGAKVELTISGTITSLQMSNIRISTTNSATTVSFTLTGEDGAAGFSNITIPKSAIAYGTTPTIYIDGQPAQDQGYTQDANNYYVWYTTHFSTHQVTIEFPSTSNSSIPLEAIYGIAIAVVVAIVALVALKKRKHTPLPPPQPT